MENESHARYLSNLAEECRFLAEKAQDQEAREAFLRLAEEFEEKAKVVVTRTLSNMAARMRRPVDE